MQGILGATGLVQRGFWVIGSLRPSDGSWGSDLASVSAAPAAFLHLQKAAEPTRRHLAYWAGLEQTRTVPRSMAVVR